MQVAEEIVKDGMTAGNAFKEALSGIMRSMPIMNVIETGTYLGTGTTLCFTNEDVSVVTIESDPNNYKQAVKNLRNYPNIQVWNGYSLPIETLENVSFSWDVPEWVVVDHKEENRTSLYKKELSYKVKTGLLADAFAHFNNDVDLVLLDSAGCVGFMEFMLAIQLINKTEKPTIIALDDTNHVKHYQSMKYVEELKDRFEILFKTDEKFGSAIVLYKP